MKGTTGILITGKIKRIHRRFAAGLCALALGGAMIGAGMPQQVLAAQTEMASEEEEHAPVMLPGAGFSYAFAAKKVSGKLLMSFWPVMIFVLCGFEHSIADIYFCVAGIAAASEYGIAADGLNMGSFLLRNLLPVTLGNIIGGAGIVGTGYWLVYLRHTPGYRMSIEYEQEELDIAEEY